MKTLDEIISRQDYIRINDALAGRVADLAEIFARKFDQLLGAWDPRAYERPHYTIKVNGHKYCAKYNTNTNKFEKCADGIRFVRFIPSPYDFEDREISLNCSDCGKRPPFKTFVEFLNDAKDILFKLDTIETELVKEAEQAIENSKNIFFKDER